MDFIKEALKKIENKMASVADQGLYTDAIHFVDTGSYMFNALVSGDLFKGLPSRATMLAGPTAVGKTFFMLNLCKNFLHNDPNGIVFYFESEGAITQDLLMERGIDLKRFVMVPVASLEDFRTQILKVLNHYERSREQNPDQPHLFMGLDSLGMLSSNKEVADMEKGENTRDMTKPQLLKGMFRTISLKLAYLNVPLVVSNHVYAVIGSYVPTNVVSGGGGAVYPMFHVIELSKKLHKVDKETKGVLLTARLQKSRFTRERMSVEMYVDFSLGLDRYHGLLEFAISRQVFSMSGPRVELPDGRKVYAKVIRENPDEYFTPDIMAILNAHANRVFRYMSSGDDEHESETVEAESQSDLSDNLQEDV